MSDKHKILIVDSTANRREDLCKLWSADLDFAVVSTGGVDLVESSNTTVSLDDLMKTPLRACLIHQNDTHLYTDEDWCKLLDSCHRVVVFGGAGIAAKGDWPDHWFWIPRAIGGKASAKLREWMQLADWFSSDQPLPAEQIDLLCRIKEARFLIAIHILCQGFLVGERMRNRVPSASAQTRERRWWSVPLLESAGDHVVETVRGEWGPGMPESVSTLIRWVAGKPGTDNIDLATIVPAVKQEIENRLSK
jgi:hypothetical protein